MQLDINIFNKKSINETIQKLKDLKRNLKKMNKDFLDESVKWIVENANSNLTTRATNFKGTTDIKNCWEIEYKGDNYVIIKNTSDYAAIVEFGIGMTGKLNPHVKAHDVKYEYDVNNHGNKGWTFIRDLNDLKFGQSKNISMQEAIENNSRFLILHNYTGYEGKSYFYDAIFDYIEKGVFKRIYKNVYKRYFKD